MGSPMKSEAKCHHSRDQGGYALCFRQSELDNGYESDRLIRGGRSIVEGSKEEGAK